MRKPLIAGNWKLNKNIAETKELADALQAGSIPAEVEVAICPTFTSLASAAESLEIGTANQKIALGAQDVAQYESGAYTGEISAEMLKEIGTEFVLVGHSERREVFNENNDVINAKTKRALEAGLKVILCCGETLETREAGTTDAWVATQIQTALDGVDADPATLVIAYEPIWAIGTGKTCDAAEANRTIAELRKALAGLVGQEKADAIRILYGGSVKSTTIEEQMQTSDIDGALIGGASLKSDEFLKIISLTQATIAQAA